MASFTPNMPTATQSLGETQQKVQDNFTVINNTISQDHVAMNTTGAGKHKFSTYITQGSNPTTALTELALFSQTTAGGQALYMIRDNILATKVALTSSKIAAPTTSITFLPGDLLFAWGLVNDASASGTLTIPSMTTIYSVSFTAWTNGATATSRGTYYVKSLSGNNANWGLNTDSSSYKGFYYTAIGA